MAVPLPVDAVLNRQPDNREAGPVSWSEGAPGDVVPDVAEKLSADGQLAPGPVVEGGVRPRAASGAGSTSQLARRAAAASSYRANAGEVDSAARCRAGRWERGALVDDRSYAGESGEPPAPDGE
ncbi:hypothetical protein Shyhy02_72410 [Streptomyces hygroscopicus subsp. hygroscopicus]|nr:hypothetical protein Shyhy02_72410 [Streptomyces hygroscopicus subsp. hygroscopicus]